MMLSGKSILILAGAAVLASTSAAAEVPVSRTVAFADLNLQSPDGLRTLERRVDTAVRAMCATDPALKSRAVADAQDRCEAESRLAARDQIQAAARYQRMKASLAGL